MISKLGTCSKCSKERYIVNRKHMMCQTCNKERISGKPAKRKPIKQKRKPTGELALFKAIWDTRPHVCQVSGVPIYEFDVRLFSHILSKGSAPKFRLYEKNIWIVTPDIHHQWEFKAHSDLPPMFKEKLELKQELKREYYEAAL